MPDIYAFDLAKSCGWAKLVDGHVTSGVRAFDGTRPTRNALFRAWLREHVPAGTLRGGLVAYERPHLRGYASTVALCGLVVSLEERAEALGLRLLTVHTGTLKKHAAGSGKATKDDVIAAMRNRWPGFDPETDDEADARAVLGWAADEAGVVLPCE